MIFSDTGLLHSQVDIAMDLNIVPPSLPKGFSLHSSGVTYCMKQHKFWTVTYNRLDEFCGAPGQESGSYLKQYFKEAALENGDNDEDTLVDKLLKHVAILAMKTTSGVSLKVETMTKLGALMKSDPKWMNVGVTILEKSNLLDCDDTLQTILENALLHCDDMIVMEKVLRLKMKSNQLLPQEELDRLMSPQNSHSKASKCFRKIWIQNSLDEMSSQMKKQKPDESPWQSIFLRCFSNELKDVIETQMAIEDDEASNGGLNHDQTLLTDAVVTCGQWAKNDEAFEPLFKEIVELTLDHILSYANKMLTMGKHHSSLSSIVVSPAFIGPLICMMEQVGGQASLIDDCQDQILNLFKIFSKLLMIANLPASRCSGKIENKLPWIFTRSIESPHPVKEGFKLQETLKLPGAKCLLLVFDADCSTCTDADRLVVYAGNSMQSKKVIECSGNSKTSSNRRIGQKLISWPKKPIIVFGDSVTIDFEVKGRQIETDSDLSWGFQISVGHCLADVFDKQASSAFEVTPLEDGIITLLPILSNVIGKQLKGNPIIPEEGQCNHLLRSKILQRCVWQEEKVDQLLQILESSQLSDSNSLLFPLSLIPSQTVATLRNLSGIALPIMRESVKKLIQPHRLEETIVSVIIKHMCLEDTVEAFLQDQDPTTPDGCLLADIMLDVYLKISSLIRRLQAIAELEKRWQNEVFNLREEVISLKDVFFSDYLHHETRAKDLELLCFLKNVGCHQDKPQKALQKLRDILHEEAFGKDLKSIQPSQTLSLVQGIFCRLDLLLRADIAGQEVISSTSHTPVMSMSLQHWPSSSGSNAAVAAKALKKQCSMEFEKALDDSILQFNKLNRSTTMASSRMKHSSRSCIMENSSVNTNANPLDLQSNPETIVQDLFNFIGSRPEDTVSGSTFLKAILARLKRCQQKSNGLHIIKTILKAVEHIPSLHSYALNILSEILSQGLSTGDLLCSQGVTNNILKEYTECLDIIVGFISMSPSSHQASLGFLCLAPYQKMDESAIVKSGLLRLLDDLTDNQEVILTTKDSKSLSQVAWNGFKLLAKRSVLWGDEKTSPSSPVATGSSSLNPSLMEKQVSKLLSNHLNQAVKCHHKSISLEAVQEALMLLKDLSASNLGQGILCQSSCISNLLELFNNQELSPQVTQTVIVLLQTALPAVSGTQIWEIKHQQQQSSIISQGEPNEPEGVEAEIMEMLLGKLGSLIAPIMKGSSSPVSSSETVIQDKVDPFSNAGEETRTKDDAIDIDTLPQALMLHKRPDQSGHELIQQLLNASSDIGIFSAMGSDSMEKVIKIDKDINTKNCAEVMCGDATRVMRSATKMAQLGFVVSIAAPNQLHDHGSHGWKHKALQICLERNNAVAQKSPSRPFISNTVANKLASEILILIHRLVSSNGACQATTWLKALSHCVETSLVSLDQLFTTVPPLNSNQTVDLAWLEKAQKIMAALTVLGGFYETIKPGSQVKLKYRQPSSKLIEAGEEGVVKHILKEQNGAIVSIALDDGEMIEVKTSLHQIVIEDPLPESSLRLFGSLAREQIPALQSVLLPNNQGLEPLCLPLPTCSISKVATDYSRMIAEIRTKCCQVLALHMTEEHFARSFLMQSCQSVDMLKYFSKEVQPSDKLCCTEFVTENLRGKFRDLMKPSSTSSLDIVSNMVSSYREEEKSGNQWNTMQTFPPLKSLSFLHGLTSVQYFGTPVTSIGVPRGVVIQAVHPFSVPADFFSIQILSLGENDEGQDDQQSGAPTISIGLSPTNARKPEGESGVWNHPEGAVLLHSNGRIVHYKGANLLAWKSVRVNDILKPGDEVKVIWNIDNEADNGSGRVLFEVNGNAVAESIDQVRPGLVPTLHLQQKGARIKATFAKATTSPAITTEAEADDDDTVDRPLEGRMISNDIGAGHRRQNFQSCRQVCRMKVNKNSPATSNYRLTLNGYPKVHTGDNPLNIQEEDMLVEEDEEEEDLDEFLDEQQQRGSAGDDLNALLVKSWEDKVFPAIRRRFRNESERRDGLEQIKGALSLGMIDIAKQTVEFLYEENGGLPTDLKLPDVDDVKKDLLTLSIEKLRPGMIVCITKDQDVQHHTNFACQQQIKTFGLEGEVVRTDVPNELAEIETYIEEEGTVVRYWYPIDCLKKSANERQVGLRGAGGQGRRNTSHSSSAQMEILNSEFILSRLYCREAFIHLLEWANNDTFSEESDQMHSPELQCNILLLQEWDIENLSYVLDQSSMSCHGDLGHSIQPELCMNQMTFSLPQFMLGNNCQAILDKLRRYLTHKEGGNENKIELIKEIISILRENELSIPHESLPINDITVLTTTLHFQDTVCLMTNAKFDQKSSLHHPEALRIVLQPVEYSSKMAALQHSSNPLVKYPQVIKGGRNVHLRSFPTFFFSTNMIKVCHSGANDTSISLELIGVTSRLNLALAFIHLMSNHLQCPLLGSMEVCHEVVEYLAIMIVNFDQSMPPPFKIFIYLSLAGLLGQMKESISIQPTKAMEKCLIKLFLELEELSENETKNVAGTKINLYSYYCQALIELSYHLQVLAPQFALDIPKRLENISKPMLIIQALRADGIELPQSTLVSSLPTLEKRHWTGRYLVLSGVPKLLTDKDIESEIKSQLSRLNGLAVSEVVHLAQQGWVVQIQTSSMQEEACKQLLKSQLFHQTSHLDVHQDTGTVAILQVSNVNEQSLISIDSNQQSSIWIEFLQQKLLIQNHGEDKLQSQVELAINTIFQLSQRDSSKDKLRFSDLLLRKSPLLFFLNGIKGRPCHDVQEDLRTYFQSGDNDKGDECMTKKNLAALVIRWAKENPVSTFEGFLNCGYNLDMQATGSLLQAEQTFNLWSLAEDQALIDFLNAYSSRFSVTLSALQPSEFTFNDLKVIMPSSLSCLRSDKTEDNLRSRIYLLLSLNQMVKQHVVPLINFSSLHKGGIAHDLQSVKGILLTSWKLTMLDDIINATVEKNDDQPGVTVHLNPLDTVEKGNESLSSSWFFQAYQSLSEVNSSNFCTPLPHSDDPHFPLAIKLSGEEVQGNSGSFRQFLHRVIEELHGSSLPLVIPYMGNGSFKGMYLIRPGPLTILEEKLLVFMGQLLGIAVRSGVPFPLGMMPHFWQTLVNQPITPTYISQADPDVHRYLQDIENLSSQDAFELFMEQHQYPSFVWQSMIGQEVELMEGGKHVLLSMINRLEYTQLVRKFIKDQLECQDKMNCILTGMHSVLPMDFIQGLLTWTELEYKVCGSDDIDLNFLKSSALYQVGLSEEDRHIQDFWNALFSLSTQQLKTFIKFACNQQRIPKQPADINNLPPPYPLKIAPADARDEAQDKLLIRAETCIFMVKIPRYSCLEVMREKLLYSIQSAEDLLSG